MGVCNCSMFCCTLLFVHFSIAIILMGKRELIALLNLSSWCLVMVERLFLAVPRGCLQFVIVVFPDHTHLLFLNDNWNHIRRECLRFSSWKHWLKRSASICWPGMTWKVLFRITEMFTGFIGKREHNIYLPKQEILVWVPSRYDHSCRLGSKTTD